MMAVALCGCKNNGGGNEPDGPEEEKDKDLEEFVNYAGTISINWGNDAAEPEIIGNIDGVNIVKHGAYVIVYNQAEDPVKFSLSGKSTKGGFKIYADTRFAVELNNAVLSNSDSCVINSQSTKRMYLVLKGSENSVSDGNNYPASKDDAGSDGEDKKGAIFSEGQIIVSGNGSLGIKGNNNHAFASDEYIRMRDGLIRIEKAFASGIKVKDYFLQEGGVIEMQNVDDGLKCSKGYITIDGGTLDITAGDDGIVAKYGDDAEDIDPEKEIFASIYVNGGKIVVNAQGKGIYAHDNIYIIDGMTKVNCKKLAKCATIASEHGNLVLTEGKYEFTGTEEEE